ncbi:glutamine cyclotransferase [Medicago truncatula]|uniref:Glutamine cyclotransferase n=1 Tax=Medicago truncatula TaxID=3880 RepID=G7JJC9_MEDTR|nr:glutamine cyclotransferase [Medicago truncatula]
MTALPSTTPVGVNYSSPSTSSRCRYHTSIRLSIVIILWFMSKSLHAGTFVIPNLFLFDCFSGDSLLYRAWDIFNHDMKDGWGLATDGKVLFGSDGSSTLYKIDPQTFKDENGKAIAWVKAFIQLAKVVSTGKVTRKDRDKAWNELQRAAKAKKTRPFYRVVDKNGFNVSRCAKTFFLHILIMTMVGTTGHWITILYLVVIKSS